MKNRIAFNILCGTLSVSVKVHSRSRNNIIIVSSFARLLKSVSKLRTFHVYSK